MSTHSFERRDREVRVHLEAESFDQLFLEGVRAIAELVGKPTADPPGPWEHVFAEATDRSRLLVAWLNELINRSDIDHLLYPEAQIDQLAETRVDARLRGMPIAEPGPLLAVATTHGLELGPVGEIIRATVTIELRG